MGKEALQNHCLLLYVKRLAHRVAIWPAKIKSPGWFHLFSYSPVQRNRDGRYADLLYSPLDQPHGLITENSGWGEQTDIRAFSLEPLRQRGSALLLKSSWFGQGAHEAIVVGG